jgi:hypothetical protein
MAVVPLAKQMIEDDLVSFGNVAKPHRVLLYGGDKVGKTTFLMDSGAFIIGNEDGFGTRNPPHAKPQTIPDWASIKNVLKRFAPGGSHHGRFPHIGFDSLDWIERDYVMPHVCKAFGWKSADDSPFQRAWKEALTEWREFLSLCERIRDGGTGLILLAHSHVKPYKNPEGPDYDRYTLALNEKAGALIRQWVDVCLFANSKTLVDVDEKTKKAKAFGGRTVMAYSERTAAFDAGNRLGLPPEFPLSWDVYESAAKGEDIDERIADLEQQIRAALATVGDAEIQKKTEGWLPGAVAAAKKSKDVKTLKETLNKLNARIQKNKEQE